MKNSPHIKQITLFRAVKYTACEVTLLSVQPDCSQLCFPFPVNKAILIFLANVKIRNTKNDLLIQFA